MFVNMSKSAGLMGMSAIFVGMRVRLTKKILPPELVQEATGEVVGIVFHPRERFGHPASSHLRPADGHPCWQQGWVRCDFLPVCVEVRLYGCKEGYNCPLAGSSPSTTRTRLGPSACNSLPRGTRP